MTYNILTTPPSYAPNAVATPAGWVDPVTGELLVAVKLNVAAEAPAEAPTEDVAEAPTEDVAEAPTETPAEDAAEATTETPAEDATETTSEAPTKASRAKKAQTQE
jgi:hypothetical protein